MTDLRVYLNPQPAQCAPETGIGRVVLAQNKYLPEMGIQLVDDSERADIIACHVNRPSGVSRVDALHIHGLHWTDTPHYPYTSWHHSVNRGIVETIKESRAVTVPSDWVGMCLRRDMRINPLIIGHGVEMDEWKVGDNLHYVLWNKNRNSDVCDPQPAWELARRGIDVISTFAPKNRYPNEYPPDLRVTGLLDARKMRTAVACADVYLATTMETFGIGTLEAMACGVPILGYAWGGTADLVRHGVEGYLVDPSDIEGLAVGLDWVRKHRADLSANARVRAEQFSWRAMMEQYARLYHRLAEPAESRVAVVVPNHNYAKYLPECIASLTSQTRSPDEIIIVDDASTDDSRAVIQQLAAGDSRVRAIYHEENQGVAAARNHGIEAAHADKIICLDADDQLLQDYIAICEQAMQEDPALGVAYTGLTLQGDGGKPIPSEWPPEFDWEVMTAVSVPPSNCIPSAAMFKRAMWERAGGYKQMYAPAEDTEFWVRGLSVGFNARKVSPAGLFLYRVHSGSASRTKTYHAIDLYHPWMRDKLYPMGAPNQRRPLVRSYAFPLVSIVIPVGPGHAQHLPVALDSILGQTMRDWEVILVDDIGDVPILDQHHLLDPYPFVRIIPWAHHHGAGAARNAGLDAARAPLALFLDADDYLDPQALEHMLALYGDSGGRYVYTDWIEVTGDAMTPHGLDEYDPEAWIERLVSGKGGLNAITVLIDTAAARRLRFDEELPGWEDSDFFARCAVAGLHGVHLSAPLLYYRTQTGSRRKAAFAERERILKLFEARYGAYLKGAKKMATCCGGSASAAILAAKRAMGSTDTPLPAPMGATDEVATVRMEFVGPETGPITYWGADGSGRWYKGANTAMHRFVNANPADVSKLEGTGKWRRVVTDAPTAASAITMPPAMTAEERRLRAERALEEAKAQFTQSEPDPWSNKPEPEAVPVVAEPEVEAAPVELIRKKRRK